MNSVNNAESFELGTDKGFIIQIITAVCMGIYALCSLDDGVEAVSFFVGMLGGWFYGFGDYVGQFLWVIYCCATVVGYAMGTITLAVKSLNKYQDCAIAVITLSYIVATVRILIEFYWEISLLNMMIYLTMAVAWCITLITSAEWIKVKSKVDSQVLLIIASVVGVFNVIVLSIFGVNFFVALVESTALVLYTVSVGYKRKQDVCTNKQKNISQSAEPEGYIKLWIFVVLAIVTFGVYIYVWIYKTVVLLNEKLQNQQSNSPAAQLLLCMFVPFYMLYWVYKNCKRIEEYNQKIGTGVNDLSFVGLLLSIFGLGIIAYALMQDQINKNLMFENGTVPAYAHVSVDKNNQENLVSEKKESAGITMEKIELLKQLKSLLDVGILTQEEFEKKKQELLK